MELFANEKIGGLYTTLASEESLAKYWGGPEEEEEAWKYLQND